MVASYSVVTSRTRSAPSLLSNGSALTRSGGKHPPTLEQVFGHSGDRLAATLNFGNRSLQLGDQVILIRYRFRELPATPVRSR